MTGNPEAHKFYGLHMAVCAAG